MMPQSVRIFIAALALSPLLVLAAEPILVYERVHRQVAHEDNAVRLVVFDDNRAEAHFPFYAPDGGTYAWRITPEERLALLELARPLLGIHPERLLEAIDTARAQNLTEVADADRVSLMMLDPVRGHHRISVPSPEIWARHLPEGHAMTTVADIAGGLAEWVRAKAREHRP